MFTYEQLTSQFDSIFSEELPPLQHHSFTLVDSQSFATAMQMTDHWNDILVAPEFEATFLFFRWGTGA